MDPMHFCFSFMVQHGARRIFLQLARCRKRIINSEFQWLFWSIQFDNAWLQIQKEWLKKMRWNKLPVVCFRRVTLASISERAQTANLFFSIFPRHCASAILRDNRHMHGGRSFAFKLNVLVWWQCSMYKSSPSYKNKLCASHSHLLHTGRMGL